MESLLTNYADRYDALGVAHLSEFLKRRSAQVPYPGDAVALDWRKA